MRLTMLHTAQVHCATFDSLRDQLAPEVELHHVVRPDWLERAQIGMSPSLTNEITDAIRASSDKVVCTCTTLGPTAAKAGAIRIDQPMMKAAARYGGPVLMAYCLESTRLPSLSLLETAMKAADNTSKIHLLPLLEHWSLFEAGDKSAFEAAIATAIQQTDIPDLKCVVLAQASMAEVAAIMADYSVPVLASPALALQAAIKT